MFLIIYANEKLIRPLFDLDSPTDVSQQFSGSEVSPLSGSDAEYNLHCYSKEEVVQFLSSDKNNLKESLSLQMHQSPTKQESAYGSLIMMETALEKRFNDIANKLYDILKNIPGADSGMVRIVYLITKIQRMHLYVLNRVEQYMQDYEDEKDLEMVGNMIYKYTNN